MKAYLRQILSALGGVLAALLLFATMANAQPAPQSAPGQIIVKLQPGMTNASVQSVAERVNCVLVKAIPYCPDYYVFRMKSVAADAGIKPVAITPDLQNTVAELRKQSEVRAADPNYIARPALRRIPQGTPQGSGTAKKAAVAANDVPAKSRVTQPPSGLSAIPNDPFYDRMWGLRAIRMPEAWAIQLGARPVVVGVADTGIDTGHPDFNTPSGSLVVGGANFFPDGVDNFEDLAGHGTHVAGSIAAATNNATGVPSVAGWNRGGVDVRFQIARVFGADFAAGAALDVIYGGVGYLVDQNVDVINLSLGRLGPNAIQLELDAINRAIAAGITVVVAAGNDAVDSAAIGSFPADIPGTIKVTSVGPDLTLASYSNFGGPVAIAAPGGDGAEGSNDAIWSTWPRTGATIAPNQSNYYSTNGTSMAAPHVAGVVALLLAAGAPRDPVAIKRAIQENAIPLDEVPDFNGGNRYGAGLVDAYSTLLPFADPPFTISLLAPRDLGATFGRVVPRITLRAIGVTKAPSPETVTVAFESLGGSFPPQTVRTLVGGRDFTVPNAIPPGGVLSTPVDFQVPGPNQPQVELGPGRYRIVVRQGEQIVGTHFIEIRIRTQPLGRTMFSMPYLVREANNTAPEQAVFGPGAVFTLARYNTVRLPGDIEYALFQSSLNGRRDQGASFSVTAPDGSPLVYLQGNPSVSVAPAGVGYWLNLDQSVELNLIGSEVTSPVVVKLFANNGGWNQIGNPFTAPVAWGAVTVRYDGNIYTLDQAITNNVIASALIGYRNGDYVYSIYPQGTLEPFSGYWVQALRDCEIVIPPASSLNLTRSAGTETAKTDGWRARLSAFVAGDRDGQNFFGQASGSEDGVDRNDIPKPPSGGGHAYLRFLADSNDGRGIPQAFDIRTVGKQNVEWTAAVSTDRTNAEVVLSWDGLANAPNRTELVLTDLTTGKVVDMRARSTYTFQSGEAGSTRKFKITMKPQISAGPLAIRNVTVVPGRSATEAGLSVRLSTNRDAEVRGVIKTLNGKVIGDLTGATRSTANGQTTLRWNGRSRSGSPVPPGPYVLEVTARTSDGNVATYNQPVQHIQ
ncbi:MAG: hypothetical protein OHK0029_27450 [Armatimonadaceae bacterium]